MRKKRNKLKFSYLNIENIPPTVKGVYAFWCTSKNLCIYVGEATDQPIKKRLKDHWKNCHNRTLKLWMQAYGDYLEICYLPLVNDKIKKCERRLIKNWRPEANIIHNKKRR